MPNGGKYKSFDFNGLTKGFEDGGLTGFLSDSRSGKRALLRKANGAPAVRLLRLRAARSAQDDSGAGNFLAYAFGNTLRQFQLLNPEQRVTVRALRSAQDDIGEGMRSAQDDGVLG
jgi:hypothetical protein